MQSSGYRCYTYCSIHRPIWLTQLSESGVYSYESCSHCLLAGTARGSDTKISKYVHTYKESDSSWGWQSMAKKPLSLVVLAWSELWCLLEGRTWNSCCSGHEVLAVQLLVFLVSLGHRLAIFFCSSACPLLSDLFLFNCWPKPDHDGCARNRLDYYSGSGDSLNFLSQCNKYCIFSTAEALLEDHRRSWKIVDTSGKLQFKALQSNHWSEPLKT